MKKLLIVSLLSANALICPEVQAATGFGSPDCGQWVRNQTPGDRRWLLGFMTGASVFEADSRKGYDPLDQIQSADQIFAWVDNYCKANPLESVGNAGLELMFVLKEKTKKK